MVRVRAQHFFLFLFFKQIMTLMHKDYHNNMRHVIISKLALVSILHNFMSRKIVIA